MEYYDEDPREDLGTYKSDPETNRRIREHFAKQNNVNMSALEKAVFIALRRFPELERGERIWAKEIKQRLSEIRKTGYPLKPYSHLNAKASWAYLQQVKNEIREKARESCPAILEEVNEANLKTEQERWLFR